jgi:hypothetical protein
MKHTQNILAIFILAIVVLIITTPFIVKNIYVFNREQSQAILLATFVFLGVSVYKLHKNEMEKKNKQLKTLRLKKINLENRLDEAFGHIGKINIQIAEIRSIFSDIKEYPNNKKDLTYTMEYFSKKILSAINIDWVMLKIVNLLDLSTLESYFISRGGRNPVKPNILNEDVLNKTYPTKKFTVITSDQQNLNLKAVCIIPKKELTEGQSAIIKAVISRLELIYVIFSSHYYKDSRSAFIDTDQKI